MKRLVASLGVTVLFGVSPAAQVRVVRYGDDRLVGISQVDVLVNTDQTGSPSCAPDRIVLQSAALDTLRAAGLKATISEKARSWFYSVIVTASSTSAASQCATFLSTELVAAVQAIPEADGHGAAGAWGSLLVGSLSLISARDVVTSSPRDHLEIAQMRLRTQLERIAARIRAANPPPR